MGRFELPASRIDTNQAPLASPDSKNRECTVCPTWVVACVHFDGDRMFLIRPGDAERGHSCHGGSRPFTHTEFFQIHLGQDGWGECRRTADCHAPTMEDPCRLCLDFPDLKAAQAEFDLRAAELRAQ